jgi:hypothetical protein
MLSSSSFATAEEHVSFVQPNRAPSAVLGCLIYATKPQEGTSRIDELIADHRHGPSTVIEI